MEIISTLRDGNVKHARVFQIALKGYGRNLLSQWRGVWEILVWVEIFLLGVQNLLRSDFDHFSWWRGTNKLSVSGRDPPTIPSVEKTLNAAI